ncbi:TROVE domain-containing protein, partial [Streptomyces goshikiensis]
MLVAPHVSAAARTRPEPWVHDPTTRFSRTYEGGPAFAREPRDELFLLAVGNFVSQRTFYESGRERDDRYARLVGRLAVEDPEWTAGLLRWLRGEGNMRTASLVGAAAYVRARLAAGSSGGPTNRSVIDSVL